jgi:hypothetical protein
MRNLHLDAVRGYCLLVMTIDHLHVYGLHRISQDTYGFFGAAEGFIFISGLVAGSYYSRLAERSGKAAMTKRAVRRARDIYLTHVLLFALMLGAAVLLLPRHPASTHMVGNHDWVHTPRPLTTLLLAASLLVQPTDFDILPFYALMMLLVPLLVRSWKARRAGWVLSLSGGLWLLSQPGVSVSLHLPAWVDLGARNFFAWQFLFVCGLTLGCLHRTQAAGAWFDSTRIWALVLLLFGLLFVLSHAPINLGAGSVDLRAAHSWLVAKQTLGPLRIFDFGLFAYLVAQVFNWYGPRLEKTLLHRYLRFLGQHSLQVFAWSILVCYAVPYSYKPLGFMGSRGAQIALALIGVATLVIPAWLHAIYRERWSGRAAPPRVEFSQRAA